MKNYIELVKRILMYGEIRADRTGVGALSVFGGSLQFDLRDRFPLVTIKETRYKTAFLEMLWFLRGEGDTSFLHKHGCKLWDAWADTDGFLGPIYGTQWRCWEARNEFDVRIYVDQIAELIRGLHTNPHGRRHIVSAWNVGDLRHMALPPCHRDFQCYVSKDRYLDLMVSQRSWDIALGAPFNVAQYALLTHLLARVTGLKERKLIFNYGDAHIYLNHCDTMHEIAQREPVNDDATLHISGTNLDIDGFKPDDFLVTGYESFPHVKMQVAV
jgi:thymidylate synthase